MSIIKSISYCRNHESKTSGSHLKLNKKTLTHNVNGQKVKDVLSWCVNRGGRGAAETVDYLTPLMGKRIIGIFRKESQVTMKTTNI